MQSRLLCAEKSRQAARESEWGQHFSLSERCACYASAVNILNLHSGGAAAPNHCISVIDHSCYASFTLSMSYNCTM